MRDFWQKKSGTAFRTEFYLYGGSSWMERHFSWKKIMFSSFGLRPEKNLTVADIFFCSVDITAISVARTLFWTFVRTFLIFLFNFDNLDLKIYTFSANGSAQLSKVYFTCTADHLMRIWIPAEKCNSSYIIFVFRLKLVSENGWNRSARPLDLHSNCAENHFGNKTKFSEKHDFFIVSGFRAQEKLTSDVLFFCLFDKTAVCVSRAQIW